ncbi:MAG: hypothetical protein ACRCYQ_04540 [Nocardioides sp.]
MMSHQWSTGTYPDDGHPAGGRHPVNILHLVMGLVFLGIVAIWASISTDVVSTSDLRWLIPLPWVIAGGLGLLVIMVSGRRGRTTHAAAPTAGFEATSDPEAGPNLETRPIPEAGPNLETRPIPEAGPEVEAAPEQDPDPGRPG